MMAAAFTVSVVIPTYNRLALLQRAVDSVLNQSYAAHEIIVIDDGSTDATTAWLAQQSLPVSFITQDNHGVSHARNRGIEKASGHWIALLDSDDFWHRDKLATQKLALLSQPDSRFCHCDELWIRNGKRINQKLKHKKQGGDIFEQCLALCVISPSAALMKRHLFDDHGLFDESLPACEDYDLWLRITAHEPVTFVDKPLLTKTGGHDDQLSRRFPIMDQFRLQSLASLLRSGRLDNDKKRIAHKMFLFKLKVVQNGAYKHDNQQLLQKLNSEYADLSDALSG